ncbi:serine hydrolase [Streptomyces sp. NPDC001922]|uniref:serine hydrolase n=1 Tax=Streptomyces sp. NPDC001922 TaxID=3364624 RepID=UPI0036B228BA
MEDPQIPGRTPYRVPAAVVAGSLVAALAAAGPAAAASPRAPQADKAPKVSCTSQQQGLATKLSQHIRKAVDGRKGTIALALHDRRTGTRCTLDANRKFDSASVVKVTVLGALLRRAMEENRELTRKEVKLTTSMITKSDNEATSTLWRQLGVRGIQHFLTLAGMTRTVPGADGYWGLTQVTAGDQMKLLDLLTSDNDVLDRDARSYARGLMQRVVAGQRWGTPAGAPDAATIGVKNGWLSRSTHGWRVHSVGTFTGGGHDYGIVVLSHGNRTMDYGIASIQGAARRIHQDLAPAASSAERFVPATPRKGTLDRAVPQVPGAE